MKLKIWWLLFGFLDFVFTALFLVIAAVMFQDICFPMNYVKVNGSHYVEKGKTYTVAITHDEEDHPSINKEKVNLEISMNGGADSFVKKAITGSFKLNKNDKWMSGIKVCDIEVQKSGDLTVKSNLRSPSYYVAIDEDKSINTLVCLLIVFILGTVMSAILTNSLKKKWEKR